LLGLEYTAASVFLQILFLLHRCLGFVSAADISKWKMEFLQLLKIERSLNFMLR
jgi:hypothetical protein